MKNEPEKFWDFSIRERKSQYGVAIGGWSCEDQEGREHGPFLSHQQAVRYAKAFISNESFQKDQLTRLGLAAH
jgi:hypothetical protein